MHDTAALLRDLVSIPSINPMGRVVEGPQYLEYRVTAYLEEHFKKLGVASHRQPVAPQRDNILARYEAPGARRTILFEVHQDTVPVDNMTIDPFGAVIEKGRLYGRGACDIKGGMAAMLSAFGRLVKERPAKSANVMMACTVDEEHTFFGVQELVNRGLKVDEAIVAEPTNLRIVNAHKGVTRWQLTTTGRSCHSSRPDRGINAIYRMARLLQLIEQYAEQLRQSANDPLLGPPTLSIGLINGGSSVNTVPDRCRIDVDRRLNPGEDPEAAPGQLFAFLKEKGFDLPLEGGELFMHCPALSPDRSKDLVQRFGATLDRCIGRHQIEAVPYGTDASTIALAGIPSIVFGPGDIAKAHTCDEWVPLDEVEQASEILFKFACQG